MKTTAAILFLTASIISFPSWAADKTPHNPTGDDKVEEGWRSGGCGSPKGCGVDSPPKVEGSTETETAEHYGRVWMDGLLPKKKL
jgi:hypothetical protein